RKSVAKAKRVFLGAALICGFFTAHVISAQESSHIQSNSSQWPQAIRIADFILSLQNADGAIIDEAGVNTVNQDSNMEYALIGLGAAYDATKNPKYLDGLEKGIKWLAQREEMADARWKGSWYYVFAA